MPPKKRKISTASTPSQKAKPVAEETPKEPPRKRGRPRKTSLASSSQTSTASKSASPAPAKAESPTNSTPATEPRARRVRHSDRVNSKSSSSNEENPSTSTATAEDAAKIEEEEGWRNHEESLKALLKETTERTERKKAEAQAKLAQEMEAAAKRQAEEEAKKKEEEQKAEMKRKVGEAKRAKVEEAAKAETVKIEEADVTVKAESEDSKHEEKTLTRAEIRRAEREAKKRQAEEDAKRRLEQREAKKRLNEERALRRKLAKEKAAAGDDPQKSADSDADVAESKPLAIKTEPEDLEESHQHEEEFKLDSEPIDKIKPQEAAELSHHEPPTEEQGLHEPADEEFHDTVQSSAELLKNIVGRATHAVSNEEEEDDGKLVIAEDDDDESWGDDDDEEIPELLRAAFEADERAEAEAAAMEESTDVDSVLSIRGDRALVKWKTDAESSWVSLGDVPAHLVTRFKQQQNNPLSYHLRRQQECASRHAQRVPESIVNEIKDDAGVARFLVKYVGSEDLDLAPTQEIFDKNRDLVFRYYESKLPTLPNSTSGKTMSYV